MSEKTAVELRIEAVKQAFEMAQKFYMLFDGKDKEKMIELAKEIYGFLASEDEAVTKSEKDHILTTKPCIRCGFPRIVQKYPHGTIHDDCFACGYPKAEKKTFLGL